MFVVTVAEARKLWAAVLLVGGLSACGSAQHALPATASANAPATVAKKTATARISIKIPRRTSSQASATTRRHTDYLSPSTKSIVFKVNGASTTVLLTTQNPKCAVGGLISTTVQNSEAYTICTILLQAPVGPNVVFDVSTYATSNGTGPALSTTSVTQSILAGQTNIVQFTLGAIPVAAVIQTALNGSGALNAAPNPYVEPRVGAPGSTFSSGSTITLVGSQTFNLEMIGIDASGAFIIGNAQVNGVPQLAITLAASASSTPDCEASAAPVFTLNVPSNYANVAVTGPFGSCPYTITFGDAEGNPTTGSPTLATFTVSASPAIYVATGGATNGAENVYDGNGNPLLLNGQQFSVVPSSGTSFGQPHQVAVDPAEIALYVADAGSSAVDAFSNGNTNLPTPPNLTGLPSWSPYGLAYDQTYGNLYASDSSGANGLSAFAPVGVEGSFGFVASYNTLANGGGVPAGLAGLTVDNFNDANAGIVYATDPTQNELLAFNPAIPDNGLVVLATGLNHPVGVAYYPNPQATSNPLLYVANAGTNGSIAAFMPATGTSVPLSGFNGLISPSGIGYDTSSGNIYVSDSGNPQHPIREFTPSGTLVPFSATSPFPNLAGGANDISIDSP